MARRKKREPTRADRKAALIGKLQSKLDSVLSKSRIGVAMASFHAPRRFATYYGELFMPMSAAPKSADDGYLKRWEEMENHVLAKSLERDWTPVRPKGPLELLAEEAE